MNRFESEKIADSGEFDFNLFWLAIDRDGHVARFQTFGEGVLPPTVKASADDAETVDEYVDGDIRGLDGSCEGLVQSGNLNLMWFAKFDSDKFNSKRQVYLNGARAAASRGIFVYDAQSLKPSGYIQIAFPAVPRKVESLPIQIERIVRKTIFRGISFAELLNAPVDLIRGL